MKKITKRRTSYDEIIPAGINFNIKEIDEMRAIKADLLRKLVRTNKIEFLKLGNKIHLSRTALVEYLNDQIVEEEISDECK